MYNGRKVNVEEEPPLKCVLQIRVDKGDAAASCHARTLVKWDEYALFAVPECQTDAVFRIEEPLQTRSETRIRF